MAMLSILADLDPVETTSPASRDLRALRTVRPRDILRRRGVARCPAQIAFLQI